MMPIDWSRRAHRFACLVLGFVLLAQIWILLPIMLPWVLGIVLVILVVEAAANFAARPEVVLSPALWLSALATARPGHALFCAGAIALLYVGRGRIARPVAGLVVLGLVALGYSVPEALFSSWSATEVSHGVWLYRAVVATAAVPLVLFALSRREDPSCSTP
jgi:hypothetical protein